MSVSDAMPAVTRRLVVSAGNPHDSGALREA